MNDEPNREKIRVCPACHGHNAECSHCGGGGADDHREGLNIIGANSYLVLKRISNEEFDRRRAQNVRINEEREAAILVAEEERKAQLRIETKIREMEKLKEERLIRSKNRQMQWLGRIVDGSEPLQKPLSLFEKIIGWVIR